MRIWTCASVRGGETIAPEMSAHASPHSVPFVTEAQYRLLRRFWPVPPDLCAGTAYAGKSKLTVLLGSDLLSRVRGKTVIDFGCGEGTEAIEMALHGAKRVIGVDLREEALTIARRRATEAGVAGRCKFRRNPEESADLIVSIDSFEHFENPALILRTMAELLVPAGEVLGSFGPTWFHPLGGHLFSVFPWAHLLFSEAALIRWRSAFKRDGATSFGTTSGGLNQMTIGRFEKIVAESPFRFASLELVPIRKLRWAHNRWTREFTTSIVRCRLVKRSHE
jgi:SAM-dependent methyltransferase